MSEYNPQRLDSSAQQNMNMTGTGAQNHMNLTGTLQQGNMNLTGTRNQNQAINQQTIPIQRAESSIGPPIQGSPQQPMTQHQMGLMSGFWNDSENRIWSVVDKAALKANESELSEQKLKAFEIISVIVYLTLGIIFTYTSLVQDPKICTILRCWGRNFGIYCLIMSILKGMSFVSLQHFTNQEEKQQIALFLKIVSYIEIGVLIYFTLAITVAILSPFDKNCYNLDTIVQIYLDQKCHLECSFPYSQLDWYISLCGSLCDLQNETLIVKYKIYNSKYLNMYGSRFRESMASPTKFEKDQKDQLISQLKSENQQLKQQDRDYQELSQHLKSLEHRYKLLYDEKSKNELEFKQRNENSLKTITQLRNELDILKQKSTEKQIENQELKAEMLACKELVDHRGQDMQRLKQELMQQQEMNRRQYEDKLNLESEQQVMRDEKRRQQLKGMGY